MLLFALQVWRAVQRGLALLKVAALINFLVFLTRGHYQFILERLLGIRSIFPHPQLVRQVRHSLFPHPQAVRQTVETFPRSFTEDFLS